MKKRGASIQGSHRFKMAAMFEMENIAEYYKLQRSEVIDLVIDAGLKEVKKVIGNDELIERITEKQIQRMAEIAPAVMEMVNLINAKEGKND
jgi:hypothetical protein